ncbi:MAG: hypothetical protein ACQKBW_09805 [Puniceicoccales bacterium]
MDFMGCGEWRKYKSLSVCAKGYEPLVFPDGFSAHWVRLTSDSDCEATAQLFYT